MHFTITVMSHGWKIDDKMERFTRELKINENSRIVLGMVVNACNSSYFGNGGRTIKV
jgi:hypothetical protein